MEKKRTRKEQAKITKSNLYEAAISLIETKGYENVSIEDITNKANTAKGTFYLYFKSKQDLIYHTIQMYDEIAERSYEKIKHLDTFEKQFVYYVQYANEEIMQIGEKILNALLGYNLTENEKFLTIEKRAIYNVLRKIIQKGYETGEIAEKYKIEFITEIIVIFLQGLDYYWCNAPAAFNYTEASKIEAEIFAKGVIMLYGCKN